MANTSSTGLGACAELHLIPSEIRTPEEGHETRVGDPALVPRGVPTAERHSQGDQKCEVSLRHPLVEVELRQRSVDELDLSLTFGNPLGSDQVRLGRRGLSLEYPGV